MFIIDWKATVVSFGTGDGQVICDKVMKKYWSLSHFAEDFLINQI